MNNLLGKALGVVTLVGLTKVLLDTITFKVEKVTIHTEKLVDSTNLRILQISDMHDLKLRSIHKRIIKTVKELQPNIIVLTGDLIDRRTKDFRSIYSFLDRLITTNVPIYFVMGNHEWANLRMEAFLTELQKREIISLSNENCKIKIRGQHINLVGVDDAATEHEDLEMAYSNIDENNYTILLSHSPYIINKYPSLTADLVISGHTHGGQIRFPIVGAVVSPGEGFFPKLDKGVFAWGKGQKLYVDSGLGTSTLPIRFLNQSQISLINIKGTIRNDA